MTGDAKSLARRSSNNYVKLLHIYSILAEELFRSNLRKISLDSQGVVMIPRVRFKKIFINVHSRHHIVSSLKKSFGKPSSPTKEVKDINLIGLVLYVRHRENIALTST